MTILWRGVHSGTFCRKVAIIAIADSDHAHDKIRRRSIPGLLVSIGWTPLFFMSKREDAVKTSTYKADFFAIHNTVEEIQAIDGRCIVNL